MYPFSVLLVYLWPFRDTIFHSNIQSDTILQISDAFVSNRVCLLHTVMICLLFVALFALLIFLILQVSLSSADWWHCHLNSLIHFVMSLSSLVCTLCRLNILLFYQPTGAASFQRMPCAAKTLCSNNLYDESVACLECVDQTE